jgi:hypothetical protein
MSGSMTRLSAVGISGLQVGEDVINKNKKGGVQATFFCYQIAAIMFFSRAIKCL